MEDRFFLKGYGYRLENNCARAPITASLLDKSTWPRHGDLLRHGSGRPYSAPPGHDQGHAHLSPCAQGTGRPREMPHEHRRPDQLHVMPWAEGESFIFDDLYNHEVWNETTEDRYILLIQIKRPCRGLGNFIQNFFLSLRKALALRSGYRAPNINDAGHKAMAAPEGASRR